MPADPSGPTALRLPEILDLKAAAPLRDDLLAARGSALTIDASGVQRLGGLCLQVLLSARDTWTADGLALVVAQPSAEFLDGLALFGAASLTAEAGANP